MIKSKAVESVTQLGQTYWCVLQHPSPSFHHNVSHCSLLGPYIESQARTEFEELEPNTPACLSRAPAVHAVTPI